MILSFSLVFPEFLSEIIQVKYLTILANQRWPIGVSNCAILRKKSRYTSFAGLCLILITTWTDLVCLSLVTIIYSVLVNWGKAVALQNARYTRYGHNNDIVWVYNKLPRCFYSTWFSTLGFRVCHVICVWSLDNGNKRTFRCSLIEMATTEVGEYHQFPTIFVL